jgi:hypothetical protein
MERDFLSDAELRRYDALREKRYAATPTPAEYHELRELSG